MHMFGKRVPGFVSVIAYHAYLQPYPCSSDVPSNHWVFEVDNFIRASSLDGKSHVRDFANVDHTRELQW